MKKYDYLIVGAGLFGAVFAYQATQSGKKCCVIDKRNHIGGNLYGEEYDGILVHKYGAHIFHTSDEQVWNFVNQFVSFNNYINAPVANYKGELYNLPFNMNTFYALWGVKTPKQAQEKIKEQVEKYSFQDPQNLEEQALSLVGYDIYEKLIKGYTEKQWGTKATNLPSFIIKRIPLRFTFDNNYFNDKYQGIPKYNELIEKLFKNCDIMLNTDFMDQRELLESCSNRIIYTGQIDQYFNYCYGELEYRSLKFEHTILEEENHQGNAVINYTEKEIPYTRIIEHKHFEGIKSSHTVVTKEYPEQWNRDKEPYYPINNQKNQKIYNKYKELADKQNKVIFGGRLGEYQYYDMDQVIKQGIILAEELL